MKKVYEKPAIVFECFTMSTNIAAGCEFKIEGQSANTCGYEIEGLPGQTLFTASVGTDVCSRPTDDNAENGFCYHVPTESQNLFNS